MNEQRSKESDFRRLGIPEYILKSIEEKGFEKPTEIQEKSIPLVIDGKDVIARASTGSGKTLVFGSGIIKNTKKGFGIQALVLTPTRELAEQVKKEISEFSKYHSLKIISIYGGASINEQIKELRNAEVVVGTPGRILDHIKRNTIDLSQIKILVLDEADRMLDMGFIIDVEKIIRKCPIRRQTLLFSATVPREVVNISRNYMNSPIEVSAEQYVDPTKLKQEYYEIDDRLKFALLKHLLENEKSKLTMVFCNTRRKAGFIAKNLNSFRINAMPIHGGLSQNKRNVTIKKFHSQHIQVLVCTDIAARGLDIPRVTHVYNYDIPRDPKDYIHRIGRTARAGEEGKAVSIVGQEQYDDFNAILRNKKLEIIKKLTPEFENVVLQKNTRPRVWREERKSGWRRDFRGRSQSRSGFKRRDDRRSNFGRTGRRFGSRNNFSGRRY